MRNIYSKNRRAEVRIYNRGADSISRCPYNKQFERTPGTSPVAAQLRCYVDASREEDRLRRRLLKHFLISALTEE
jgi:hypothetical protein